MAKKLPSSITILGRKVKIKQGKNLTYEGRALLGLCDYDNKIIYIEKDQKESTKRETLLHEIYHFHLELTGFSQKMSDSENEVACQLFTALYLDLHKII